MEITMNVPNERRKMQSKRGREKDGGVEVCFVTTHARAPTVSDPVCTPRRLSATQTSVSDLYTCR